MPPPHPSGTEVPPAHKSSKKASSPRKLHATAGMAQVRVCVCVCVRVCACV